MTIPYLSKRFPVLDASSSQNIEDSFNEFLRDLKKLLTDIESEIDKVNPDTLLSVSANYTATTQDKTIQITANSPTISLPPAADVQGKKYNIKNSGSGTVTVDPNSSETIDASSTLSLTQYESVEIQSDGTGWILLSSI